MPRFSFGKNWKRFLRDLKDDQVEKATKSLSESLGVKSLAGKRFLDVGSGSGIHSLCARRIGADVISFDYDPQSVECTSMTRARFLPNDPRWKVLRGSALDVDFLKSLGDFDIVYSWGVLHHTGDMRRALFLVADRVKPGGNLFISIYNDQGYRSTLWWWVKRFYVSSFIGRITVLAFGVPGFMIFWSLSDLIRLRNPINRYFNYSNYRGMSVFTDLIDWLGGFPFEVASEDWIVSLCDSFGFELVKLNSCRGSLGTNEFIFKRRVESSAGEAASASG